LLTKLWLFSLKAESQPNYNSLTILSRTMKTIVALVAVSSAVAFQPAAFVGRRYVVPSLGMTKAEEAIAEAKAAVAKYGASSPEARVAWEGKSMIIR
jgi:hypothetical protein